MGDVISPGQDAIVVFIKLRVSNSWYHASGLLLHKRSL